MTKRIRSRAGELWRSVRTCPSDIIKRALSSLQRIDDVKEQTGTIFILVPFLTGGYSDDLLNYFAGMTWDNKQITTLTNMVLELSSALKGGVLDDFVKEAAQFSSEWWIVEALSLTILRINDFDRLRGKCIKRPIISRPQI